MAFPKKKTNINVFEQSILTDRRQELLDNITKSDTYLPEGIYHEDLDLGVLNFAKKNFKVVSNGEVIPIIEKILTVQRWGEISANWTFTDTDGTITLPFIAVVRKPDAQPGTHPVVQRTIPDIHKIHYQTVPTWDGNQFGANVYKIPQPTAIDISYEIIIVCNDIRDSNNFNRIMLQQFRSRQAYTYIKGHYMPIIMESNTDSSPIDNLDGRRFYSQTYNLILLGLLFDSEEFEVKPAINKLFILNEVVQDKNFNKQFKKK